MTYGATITSIKVPDAMGQPMEICCGFDQLEGYFGEAYMANAPYFGCTVGRYCSQIKGAQFTLQDQVYPLAENVGKNNLHGGIKGFDKQVWKATPFEQEAAVGVDMEYKSLDKEEGFPGNVDVKVRFSLGQDNTLSIEYTAVPDQETPLALTNHTYFNLTGFATDNEEHVVKIHASQKLEMDETGAATGKILPLDGAIDDLRDGQKIGTVHHAMDTGFEHYYLFDKDGFAFEEVAEIHAPDGGLSLVVATTEPGMLFYSGMYTSDELSRENGQQFGKYRAFCCETHRYPNGPNIPGSPQSTTQAGETFSSKTTFTFRS